MISSLAAHVNRMLDRVADSYVDLRDAISPAPHLELHEHRDGTFRRIGRDVGTKREASAAAHVTAVFDPSHFLILTLTLPEGAKPYLKGVIASQIDRISPWTAERAIFGAAILKTQSNMLTVRVAIAARDDITKRISTLGLFAIRSLTLRVPTDREGIKADIDIPFETARHSTRTSERRAIAAIFFGAIILASSVQLVSVMTRSSTEQSLQMIRSEIAELRKTLGGARGGDQKSDPLARMIAQKTDHVAAVELVDALAAAIPDHTYLTAIELEPKTFHIEGNSTNVTDLPQAIGSVKLFGEVRFSAPTAKRRDGNGETFQIDIALAPPQKDNP